MMPFRVDGGIQMTNTDEGLLPVTSTLAGASSGTVLRVKSGKVTLGL